MKLSVITPLHEPGNHYIAEAHASLAAQTVPDFEWVIVENNGGAVPEAVRADPRVRVVRSEATAIGALKRCACEAASGEVIVELDADDLLTEDALESVAGAVAAGAEFVYSDFAEFDDRTWQPNVYDAGYGWRTRPFLWRGHQLVAMLAPEATEQNVRRIEWAPNHVRAWTRAAYEEVGGHDPEMAVADDHELVVRFLLAGKRLERLARCLYLYRVHKDQAVKAMNAEIQAATNRVYERYVWRLAEQWATRRGLLKVDLGGGIDPVPGYTVLDRMAGIRCDLEGSWPLADGAVGLLRAHDIVEHLREPVHTMNEAYRVLAPGGWLMIHVPSALGQGAFQDPTHRSFWVKNSFLYYTDRRYARYVPEFTGRFAVSRVIEWFPSRWHREENVPYVEAHLLCLKPGYAHMGVLEI